MTKDQEETAHELQVCKKCLLQTQNAAMDLDERLKKATRVLKYYANRNNWYPVEVTSQITRLTPKDSNATKKAEDCLKELEGE